MQLTPFQLQQYDTFGFLIIRNYLSYEFVDNCAKRLAA